MCVCVCVCVCARARAGLCVCVCVLLTCSCEQTGIANESDIVCQSFFGFCPVFHLFINCYAYKKIQETTSDVSTLAEDFHFQARHSKQKLYL